MCVRERAYGLFFYPLIFPTFQKIEIIPLYWYTVSTNMAYLMSSDAYLMSNDNTVSLRSGDTWSIPYWSGMHNYLAKLWAPPWAEILAVSMDCEDDEYDRLGRNVSAQKRRQALFPWFTVVRSNESDHWEEEN